MNPGKTGLKETPLWNIYFHKELAKSKYKQVDHVLCLPNNYILIQQQQQKTTNIPIKEPEI